MCCESIIINGEWSSMGDMFRRCWIRRIFMNEKCKKYDDMSDVFEYGNISDDEIVKLCNQILLESKD